MDIITLGTNNFIGLSATYPHDRDIHVVQDHFFTEQGINLSVSNILKSVNDNKINNYSNLFLTGLENLNNNLQIKKLDELPDEGFSTYFACNAFGAFTPVSRFWVVDEPNIYTNSAGLVVSGTSDKISNGYFFDLELITNKFCKISHENNGIIRYLTVDYTGNLSFCKDVGLDSLGQYSPQIFYYVYDRNYDYIILIKNINDICKFVTFDNVNLDLTLVDPITGTSVPYTTSSIFRLSPRAEAPNKTKLYDPWVSYKKDLKTNTLTVNDERSFENIKSNVLINNEYYSASEKTKSLDVNLLSLKNTSTSFNNQSRGNPFFDEDNVQFRDYKTLITGSNQTQGNDNILFNYETYSTSILLKKDKITYFHVPQVFYPFIRLNINDSNLIEAGAIAGDHPLKSDKIFKKRADYKYSSPFGETIDETIGSFLCSWLSGSNNANTKPVWVDRYFNPKRATFITALTASDYKAVKYISLFDCISLKAEEKFGDIEIFDKPSDLVFEAGTYYAYHHYGPNDVDDFIKVFSKNLVQNNFTVINNSDGSVTFSSSASDADYILNNNSYLVTNGLSSIQESNQFTLIFDAYSKDWTKPIGYQLLGNYNRDGFGIFNQNVVTPLLFFYAPKTLLVSNTDMKIINYVEQEANISGAIKLQGLTDTYLILSDNSIRRFNLAYAESRKVVPGDNAKIGQLYSVDNDENYAYLLYNNGTPIAVDTGVKAFNLKDNAIDNATNSVEDARGIDRNERRTINVYKNVLYFTDGNKAQRTGTNIFYQKNNSLRLWRNIGTSIAKDFVAFTASSTIEDFTIDFDQNLWIIYNKNRYVKFTNKREFLLSGTFADSTHSNYCIFPVAQFESGEYVKKVVIGRKNNSSGKLQFITTLPDMTVLNTTNTAILTSSNMLYSNSTFVNNYVNELYPDANFSVKAQLVNVYNANDTETAEIVYNLSALDPGYHNFAIRFDSYEGFMHLFIDGQLQEFVEFKPRKYKFSNLASRPFLIGTSNYSFGIPLYTYLQQKNSYMTKDFHIKNFYLYNKPLYDFDIMFHTRKGMRIDDLKFDIACGRRNYLEEVERYFKIDPPGSKSTLYNVMIRNTNIKDAGLRYALEQRIIQILNNTAPAYSKLNQIYWVN